jgi:enoyl-CoA hydratase
MLTFENIIYEKEERIARITLNRPEKLNALSQGMLSELTAALREAEKDEQIRVVIIKGAGRSFCTGYDMGEEPFLEEEGSEVLRLQKLRGWIQHTVSRWFEILWNYPKPIIAQVHGYCMAGGAELAVMSDLTVVAEDAQIGYPPVRVHGPGAVILFPYLAGLKKAKELILTGDSVSGKEAVELGFANRAVPSDQLEAVTTKLAQRVANVAVEVSSLNKAAMNKAYELMGVRAAMEWAADLNTMGWFTDAGIEWNQLVKKRGLRGALEERDRPFREGEKE